MSKRNEADLRLLIKHLRLTLRGAVISCGYESPCVSSPLPGVTRKFYLTTDTGSVGGYITMPNDKPATREGREG